MFYLKLDKSAIFVKKIPIRINVKDAVMYYRKCYILCKLLRSTIYFFLITYQYKTRTCQKKNSRHLSYHMRHTIKHYSMCANNWWNLCIVGLRCRLVKFKASQVKRKLTSLRVVKILVFGLT